MIDRLFTRLARPVQGLDTGRDNVMDDSKEKGLVGMLDKSPASPPE